ncbi:LodA/GoxA family CTQ-dependent oxidase [Nitrosopumilus ureiphilus]|uniref:Uncharacterized protein n=1 Tax=Nitrosopumilus ureiphilus TaxID=1470067 RepID=A0A7D5REM9_9ARCH|nr:LodA/GoxA family CTQ-dependent oxidase [Nitrosopumilus ureiphilus]QLH07183.1 hypothetical protein C5F50_08905 [Nitrosopumilus ureiphilus]
MSLDDITKIKIYPAIGITRLGNSPSEYFIEPEIPEERLPPADGFYKDNQCRIKRQASRFRLFGYDQNDNLVQEITKDDGAITWRAHLANKKAAGKIFAGSTENPSFRNSWVDADPQFTRNDLKIDPGERSVTGPNQMAQFDTGTFLGENVYLGKMQTDDLGRLLVLGGHGKSSSVPPDESVFHYANNDRWYDDVSDGPVNATVILNGRTEPIESERSWIICAPPNFAPAIDTYSSLYDILLQLAEDKGIPHIPRPTTPSYKNDIFPILERTVNLKWVVSTGRTSHGILENVISNPPGSMADRQIIFGVLKNPNDLTAGGRMPVVRTDGFDDSQAVTKIQYYIMQKWAADEFDNDWNNPPTTNITPEGLDRAALEPCVGGPFFPGIESSWFIRERCKFTEAFRLDNNYLDENDQEQILEPGDITKWMAVPWQADFRDCVGTWWPAQRPDSVIKEGSLTDQFESWTGTLVNSHRDMVDNWHKLGFVVKKGDRFVETERSVTCKKCYVITDRSHFSKDEVDSVLTGGVNPAHFTPSLYVVVEGFLPNDLNINAPNLDPAQLVGIAPQITLRRTSDNTVPAEMSTTVQELLLEDPTLPANLRQRFTFVYSVDFTGTRAFFENDGVTPIEIQNIRVIAEIQNESGEGNVSLIHQPNPYMLDGSTHWLSTDVRVFQVKEGESPSFSNLIIGNTANAAINFIQDLTNDFNSTPSANHPFDMISTDANTSKLELSRSVDGRRVFNFAVAKVRYRGEALSAENVRVFFRLFTTAATNFNYNSYSTYRRFERDPNNTIPLLGLADNRIGTIPFFAESRVDPTTQSTEDQTDITNVRTISPAGGGGESSEYFGCWLDFNQTEAQFPAFPSNDGPFISGEIKSIQELIRGMHQCLAAEVFFESDPIPQGATPSSNDNLSQRNLVIVESTNPTANKVQHTFEIRPSEKKSMYRLTHRLQEKNNPPIANFVDELMFNWGNLPRSSTVTLYMPDLDANEIISTAGKNYESERLFKVDDHTIKCLVGDVTYVPIPNSQRKNIAGLITIELPHEIKCGQVFDTVIMQINRMTGSVLGSFQITIPIMTAKTLLKDEIRKLSVLRHIEKSIPSDDHWHSIFQRYTEQVAERVKLFGGNPIVIKPSPDGDGGQYHKIRLIIEQIQILDDHDPFLKGKGEFRFKSKIKTDTINEPVEVQFPKKGTYSISDRPGKNIVKMNEVLYEGTAYEYLGIQITGIEMDTFDPDDNLCFYKRVFTGNPDSWYGTKGPKNEQIELEDLGDWKIWYRIEKA